MDAVMEYNLVFKGEVEEGHDISATKKKLASAFKLTDEKVDTLFSGRPTVIKKGLSFESGKKLQQQLLNIGAKADLELSTVKKSPTAPVKSQSRIPPVSQSRPTQKVELVLQPIQEAVSEDSDNPDADAEAMESSRFSFPDIKFSLGRALAVIFFLLGMACLIVYSPFTDYVVRKGFLLGGFLVFIGYRILRK